MLTLRRRTITTAAHFVSAAAMLLTAVTLPAQGTNWSALETTLGHKGAWNNDSVFKFTFPRTDLTVTKDGVTIRPALALTSWVAFMPAHAGGVMTMGDLVVTEMSVQQVVARLHDGGANPTAVHNHLLGESPHVMYIHFMATGDAAKLARTLHDALVDAGLPDAPAAGSAPFDMDTLGVARALGRSGKVNGGVWQVTVARGKPVHMGADVVPAAMGLATAINMQPTGGGKAAITGDFVLIESEIAPVMQALALNGIQVTALHSHITGEEPRLYFMHFWANANAVALARGLAEALSRMDVR